MKTTDIKVGFLTQDQADALIKHTEEEAREFVKLALKDYKKDGNQELFFHNLLRAVKWIGVSKVSRQTGLSRVCLYDTLDGSNPNPSLNTLTRILAVLGVKLSFELAKPARKSSAERGENYAWM